MVTLPLEIAEISPVEPFIKATEGLLVDHRPPEMVEEKVVYSPTQSSSTPDIVPASARGVTVMDRVAKSSGQPPAPDTVYVKIAVPADTPVTTPEVGSTVATAGFPDDQIPPGVEEEKVRVSPSQTSCVPLSVPASGGAVTQMLILV